jgi:hypothetical protein
MSLKAILNIQSDREFSKLMVFIFLFDEQINAARLNTHSFSVDKLEFAFESH